MQALGDQRSQAHVGVVRGRVGDRPLDLTQRPLGGSGRLRQRSTQCPDQEVVGLLVEREGRRLAGLAYDPAGRRGEAAQTLARAAGSAAAELGDYARGQQQLEAKRQSVRGAGVRMVAVQQVQLRQQQLKYLGVWIGRL